jgi:hypothetical protein
MPFRVYAMEPHPINYERTTLAGGAICDFQSRAESTAFQAIVRSTAVSRHCTATALTPIEFSPSNRAQLKVLNKSIGHDLIGKGCGMSIAGDPVIRRCFVE